MFIEIGVLAAGIIPGRLLKDRPGAHKPVARATMLSIYALLFILGAKIGGNQALFESLDELGVQALTLGFLCTMGSGVFARLAAPFFRTPGPNSDHAIKQTGNQTCAQVNKPTDSPTDGQTGKQSGGSALTGSLIILGFFVAGLLLAKSGTLPPDLYSGNLSLYLLWLMLFCVGAGVGFDLGSLLIVRELGLRVLLIPLLTVAGAFAGACLAFPLLDLDLRSCLITSAGLGYYSLASVVVSESCGAAMGSISLIANLFRELFCLLATPLLVRLIGPLGTVAASGAPAMDTCLPVIARSTNERYAIIAIFNGLVLTILVPVLLPLLIG
ncbi:MAG: lysine exporter LysO family protein [Deltaproteobacteria bacterium]|jgi:uncharacterized membrane protein YbjE (DUF340 family)|nr:lysine exporter LysO family protein [Deltaproteobacteria bacterium]